MTSNKWIFKEKSKYLNYIKVFPFFHFIFLLKRNLQDKTWERPEAVASTCNFIKKETLPQVFSCEFYNISKNTFSNITPPVIASEKWRTVKLVTLQRNFFAEGTGNMVNDHYARNRKKIQEISMERSFCN